MYAAIAKSIVNNMNGWIIGGVVTNIIKNYRPRFNNRALDLLADVSGVVTGWVVGKMVHDHIRRSAEQQVDKTIKQITGLYKKITRTV